LFNPIDGVDDSGPWPVPEDGSGYAGAELFSMACYVTASDGAVESVADVVELDMESNSLIPTSSM
jgi:hypothetical protein